MGIIPGGKNGLAKRVVENLDTSAAKLAVVFCALCTIMGLYVTFQDFRASALGWGLYVSSNIGDDPGMQSLAIIISLAPQLVQTTLNVLFTADAGFVSPLTIIIYIISFGLDSGLDYMFLTQRGGNPWMSLLIVVGAFFVLSEVMLGVFGALTMALAKEVFAQKVKPGLPSFMGGPPPGKGARPSAGPRPPQHRPTHGAPAPVPVDVEELLGKAGGRR